MLPSYFCARYQRLSGEVWTQKAMLLREHPGRMQAAQHGEI